MHFPGLTNYKELPRKYICSFTKLVVKHAVLLASVLVLKDDVDAPVLCISDGLPAKDYCDPETFQCLGARLLPREGMARAQEDAWFYFLQLLPTKVHSAAMWPLLLSCFLLMGTGEAWRCAQNPWRCCLMGHRGGVGGSHLFRRGKSFQLLPVVSHSKLDPLHSDHLGGCQPWVDRPQLCPIF